MKIGIDLTSLPHNPVGAGTYLIQLVRAISLLKSHHRYVLISQPHGRQLVGEISNPNMRWEITPHRTPAARLMWEQTALPNLARQQSLDLVHSPHYTRPYFLPCRSVVTFHDMTFFLFPELHTFSKRLFFPQIIRMSARRADKIIAVSESTRRDALKILDISPEKILSVPNGVSTDFRPILDQKTLQDCKNKYNLPDDFILYVGVIEPRKNLPMLLQAYSHIQKYVILPQLVLVGRKGWHFDKVFSQIRDLGIEQKVHFTGYIPGEDLPAIYNLAQFFVYPSSYEGFGFPPLESMACGTPVITTAVSAMLETVGDAGVLVPPQDTGALSEAILKLLTDRDYQTHLSNAGQNRAREFTWERTARETVKIYEQVIG